MERHDRGGRGRKRAVRFSLLLFLVFAGASAPATAQDEPQDAGSILKVLEERRREKKDESAETKAGGEEDKAEGENQAAKAGEGKSSEASGSKKENESAKQTGASEEKEKEAPKAEPQKGESKDAEKEAKPEAGAGKKEGAKDERKEGEGAEKKKSATGEGPAPVIKPAGVEALKKLLQKEGVQIELIGPNARGVIVTGDADTPAAEKPAATERPKAAEGASGPAETPREPTPPMFYMRDGTRLAGVPALTELEIDTAYGKLVVPVEEVEMVRFASSADPEVAQKIEKLIAQLGHEEFDLREAAMEELRSLGRAAVPALREAMEKSDDEEIRTRAEKLLEDLEEEAEEPDENELHLVPLEGDEDEVKTRQFTVRGRVLQDEFHVKTRYGNLVFKRRDILSIVFREPLVLRYRVEVPGSTMAFRNQWLGTEVELAKGERFRIRATGTIVLRNYGNTNCGPEGTTNVPAQEENFPAGALVGRIGEDGKPFLVGSDYEGTAEKAGKLYLGIALRSASVTGNFEATIEKRNPEEE